MTTTPDPQPAAQIQAPPESRLAQLQASYPDPGASRVDLAGGAHGPALQLTYSESWRVDATRLKAEQPVLYVQYAKKSGSWSLAEAKGGEA
jgi:hypothetical protein